LETVVTVLDPEDRQDLEVAVEKLDALWDRSGYTEVRAARNRVASVLERNPPTALCERCGGPFGQYFGAGFAHGPGFCIDRREASDGDVAVPERQLS
jgi:hypothetical protein